MSTELAPVASNLPAMVTNAAEDAAFNEMAASAKFLPRIELFSSSRKPVKAGKFKANHWGIIKEKDKITDAGDKVLIYPLDWRFRALDFTDLKKVKSVFTHTDPEFIRIKEEAERKRDPNEECKCVCGIEFLLVVKDHGFVTYLCGSKSAKAIAGTIRTLAKNRQFGQLSSYFKEAGKFSWQAPDVGLYQGQFDLPSVDEMTREIQTFKGASGVMMSEKDLEGLDDGGEVPPENRVR